MFESLSRHRVVIVTGPQRAGTTLCARAIAMDAHLRYIDEEDYGVKDVDAWSELARTAKGAVIHSPAMARYLDAAFGKRDMAVVWMLRPLREILASCERIGWAGEADEIDKYKDCDLGAYHNAHISQRKLYYWRTYQKRHIRYAYEVRYSDLATHPLWLPAERRRHFGPRQWSLHEEEPA